MKKYTYKMAQEKTWNIYTFEYGNDERTIKPTHIVASSVEEATDLFKESSRLKEFTQDLRVYVYSIEKGLVLEGTNKMRIVQGQDTQFEEEIVLNRVNKMFDME